MKAIKFFLIIIVFYPLLSTGQNKNSWDGDKISPHSNLRILNICINVIYDVNSELDPQPNDNQWGRGTMEGINNGVIHNDRLLDFMDITYIPGNLHGFITRFFGESSFDALQLIGDFVIVNIKESRVLTYGSFDYSNIIRAAIAVINITGLQTLYGHNNIADYDYENKNQIYFTHAIIRNITKTYGNLAAGDGYGGSPINYGSIKIGSVSYPFSGRGIIVGSLSYTLISHEIGHSLLGSNNFHTMGGNHRLSYNIHMPFFTVQNGYGVMAGSAKTLESCNGYERWRMHWKHANAPYYISARNTSNNNYLNSDISKANGNVSFVLRDFVTYGDAIRIKLPYKDSEDASNQYIWLENHKTGLNDKLDYLQYSDNADCRPKGIPGIYAYYQIGKDILTGTNYEVWDKPERDNLRMITAEGYWDFSKHDTTPYNMRCITWADDHSYHIRRDESNPFCGYHDLETHLYPDNSDKTLMLRHETVMWRKVIGNSFIDSLASLGDNRDVFSGYNKINMGTNPSTCNAKTYYNYMEVTGSIDFTNPTYSRNNLTTYLTGLSIEMTTLGNNDIQVNIRWDDYDVTNRARWTGKISNKEKVNLTSGNIIELVQNKTPSQPYRDSITGLFAETTELTCEENSVFTQQPNSRVILSDKSKLHLKSGSEYTIMPDALLHISSGSKLEIEDCAVLRIQGFLTIEDNVTLNIHPNAVVIINDINNIYYNGNINALFSSYIVGDKVYKSNDVINQNTTLNSICVESGVTLTIQNATVRFPKDGKIIVKPGGRLIIDGSTLTNSDLCNNQLWQGIEVLGDPSTWYQTTNYQGMLEMKNGSTIENAVCGVSVGERNTTMKGGGIITASNSVFKNNQQAVNYQRYQSISPYGVELWNMGTFTGCVFITDDNALFSANPINTMVYLSGVRDIKFYGCIFKDTRQKNTLSDYGIGIYANAASVTVTAADLPSTGDMSNIVSLPTKICEFSGFGKAIVMKDAGTRVSKIHFTNFMDNNVAIYAGIVNKLSIVSCKIDVNASSITDGKHGIYLEYSDGYTIGNNQFSGNGTGLRIKESGEGNNFVENNSFSNMCLAIVASGINGQDVNNIGCKGLTFNCNEFMNNSEDIRVDKETSHIRFMQGFPYSGAGNVFKNSQIALRNASPIHTLAYYYDNNDPDHYPTGYKSNNLFVNGASKNNCNGIGYLGTYYYTRPCREVVITPGIGVGTGAYIKLSSAETASAGYTSSTMEGETNGDYVPLTLEVLTSAYNKKQEDLTEKINTYNANTGPINWDETSMNVDAADMVLPQVELYVEITELQEEITLICKEAFHILLNVKEFDRQTYNTWLVREHSMRSDYLLAQSYVEASDWGQADNVLQKIPERFPQDNDYTQNEINDFRTCLEYENQWNENPESISDSYFAMMGSSLTTFNGIASVKLTTLLERILREILFPYLTLDNKCIETMSAGSIGGFSESSVDGNQKSINSSNSNEQSLDVNSYSLAVYPNPSDGVLHLNLENTITINIQTVDVYDIYGRQLRTENNIDDRRTTIDLSGLSNGIYFVRVVMNNGETKIKRIIKE